jgi:hypothetical protein
MRDVLKDENLDFDIMCGVPYGAIPLSTVCLLLVLFNFENYNSEIILV